jgi:hypothetical protein
MPSAKRQNRHPRPISISSWLTPFFPPQKRHIASFLQAVNKGISTTPPTLITLRRNTPSIVTLPITALPNDVLLTWSCPLVSPCHTGALCPFLLYGSKTIPPTRLECKQLTMTRHRHHKSGSGPNHRRSRRRHLQRSPPTQALTISSFYTPLNRKRLTIWPFSCHRISHIQTPATTIDNTNDNVNTIPSDNTLLVITPSSPVSAGILPHDDDSTDPEVIFDHSDSDNISADDTSHSDMSNPPHVHPTFHPTTVHRPTRTLDISSYITQNAHGLRRRPRDTDGNIIPGGPFDYTCYEHLIASMKTKHLDIYFVQETWLEGDVFDEVINDYHVFRHTGDLGNHNFRGVAIVLSPRYHAGWKAAGARPPITTDAKGEFSSRFISITIKLDSHNK